MSPKQKNLAERISAAFARMQLLEDARPALCLKIGRLIGGNVRSSFIDVNLERGEILQIFVLQEPLGQVV